MITRFDKDACKVLRIGIASALEDLGKKYGVDFKVGGMRFSDNSVSIKLEAAVLNGSADSFDEVNFKENCHRYGLKPEDFGRIFGTLDGEFKITGIKTRNRKYPILTTRISDGKPFKFSPFTVKISLNS